MYRLTAESISDAGNGDYNASYRYDAVGIRTQQIIDGVTTAFSYDDNDRLTQQGGTTYTYDDNGNTLSETLGGETSTYRYDARNKLTEAAKGGVTTRYSYNANGIRSSKTQSGITTSYIIDENRDYAQVLIEDDGADQVIYTYGDDLLSQGRGGAISYHHYCYLISALLIR